MKCHDLSGRVGEWLKPADCKSAAPCGLRRFESSPVHHLSGVERSGKTSRGGEQQIGSRDTDLAWVAQLVERVLGKDEVTGSIPVPGSRN